MPRIIITVDGKAYDIPDAAVPRLQVVCDRTNAAQKTALSLGDWIALHLREIAIADDLAAATQQLQQQKQADAQAALDAAIRSVRNDLLASLAERAPS